MTARTAVVALVVACSAPPPMHRPSSPANAADPWAPRATPAAEPATAATVPTAAPPSGPLDVDAIDVPPGADNGQEAHACREDGGWHGYCDDGGGGDCGFTLDQLKAQAAKQRPIAGTCDGRLRDRVEAEIVHARAGSPGRKPTPWDHRRAPAYRELVTSVLAVTADEQARLARDGIVVPARLAYRDYASAYYDVHRGQLPLFVTADSILHAIYASHDHLLAALERKQLARKLDDVLTRMHCALAAAAKQFPAQVADDLDVYLAVARALLSDGDVHSELCARTRLRAEAIVALVKTGGALTEIQLFGRWRRFDASQYQPRGHYEGDEQLARYFRAAMWLSRFELNLSSRDTRSSSVGMTPDPTQTPREAVDALALAELAQRAGALAELGQLERAWGQLAGAREDISLAELVELRARAHIGKLAIPESADKLREAIGERYARTVNVFPNPNVAHLPAIATVLGPRITPDTVALQRLPTDPHAAAAAADLGFALGHDRGRAYAGAATQPELAGARAAFASAPSRDDLYGAWFDAIRALAIEPRGTLPSFMHGPAFADLRLDSALAAFGQLRHNHVLLAAQRYDVGGCEIPDAYVEPAPAVYEALATWARRGHRLFASLDPKDETGGTAYFQRVTRILDALSIIAHHELANVPLTGDEQRFLAMVVEMREVEAWNYNGHFPVPTYDGWYIDLFPSSDVAFEDAGFIADYATHVVEGVGQWVDYLGARGPHLGLFVVDVGGAPRMMTGPVASAFAAAGPIADRYTDATVGRATAEAPWAASYTAAAPAEPALAIQIARPSPPAAPAKRATGGDKPASDSDEPEPGESPRLDRARHPGRARDQLELVTAAALGTVTIELRDHHFVKLASFDVHVGKGTTKQALPALAGLDRAESVLVRVGAFSGRVDLDRDGFGSAAFGGATPIADAGSRR